MINVYKKLKNLLNGKTLKRQMKLLMFLRHTNSVLEVELALYKSFNVSKTRDIARLEKENVELKRKLYCKEQIAIFAVPKSITPLAHALQDFVETREPVITNKVKVEVFDKLKEIGIIRKLSENDLDVIYEIRQKEIQ